MRRISFCELNLKLLKFVFSAHKDLFFGVINRPFPSSPGPLFQNQGRCSAFDMETIFHSHANKTHFHKKGCAPSLILKVRVFGTRKWSIYSPRKV